MAYEYQLWNGATTSNYHIQCKQFLPTSQITIVNSTKILTHVWSRYRRTARVKLFLWLWNTWLLFESNRFELLFLDRFWDHGFLLLSTVCTDPKISPSNIISDGLFVSNRERTTYRRPLLHPSRSASKINSSTCNRSSATSASATTHVFRVVDPAFVLKTSIESKRSIRHNSPIPGRISFGAAHHTSCDCIKSTITTTWTIYNIYSSSVDCERGIFRIQSLVVEQKQHNWFYSNRIAHFAKVRSVCNPQKSPRAWNACWHNRER